MKVVKIILFNEVETLKANFSCEPVGQGLFYKGKIEDSIVVYDCGSNNKEKLEECIDQLETTINKEERIHVLMISHFHEDHINGIEILLSKFKVDNVVIPYIDNIERALLLAKKGYGKTQSTLDILIDPVRYFLHPSRRVKRIIFIAPGKGVPSPDNPEDFYNDNNEDEVFNIRDMEEDKELIEELSNDTFYKTQINNGKLFILQHDKYAVLNNTWKFKFFNLKVVSNVLRKFEIEIKSILNFQDKEILNEQLKNKSIRKQISECYAECFNKRGTKFNDTSLVVYHGPIKTSNMHITSCVEGCATLVTNEPCFFYPIFHNHESEHLFTGQLLCGDISLSKRDNYFEWQRHYTKELNDITFMLLPHHGSIHNWNSDIIKDCKNLNLFMASSAFSNKYGHPSLELINILRLHNKMFINGNEFVGTEIKINSAKYFL